MAAVIQAIKGKSRTNAIAARRSQILQHWRGVSGIFAPEAALVIGF